MSLEKSELDYFKEELEKMIYVRYKTLTCAETIGVLELVKHSILMGMLKTPKESE